MFNNNDTATVFMPTSVTPATGGNTPPAPPPSKNKSGKKTLIFSLIALFILGGGIFTGLTLVSQQQDLRSRAEPGLPELCPTGSARCDVASFPGAVQCEMVGSVVNPLYCCPAGKIYSATEGCRDPLDPGIGVPSTNPNTGVCDQSNGQYSGACSQKPPGSSWPFLNTNGSTVQVYCCKTGDYVSDGMTRNICQASTTPGCGSGGNPPPPPPPPGGGTPCSCYCAGSVQCSQQNGTGTSFCGEGSCGFQKCSTDTSPCYIAGGGGGGGGGGAPPPPKKVCGETCSVNTDCANAATPGVSVICRNGFCENADCPQGQTVYGVNCTCGSNSRLCGQTCGATVGLCAEGSCTYTGGPSCAVGAPTYCAGYLNGYNRLSCVDRDQGNNYLRGPSGKTSAFSEAEIRASCSPVCPVGGTTGRKASCGGLCQVDSDCRAPSGGGTALCRGGVCENTACPAGKTLAGSACLCAGESFQTQQCGQPCYLGALCAPGQGICRYINTGGNNCPWGWSQTYCVGTLNGFTHPQCAAGDTGGAYLVAPDGRSAGIALTELRQSCIACGDGIVQPGEDCDDGAANGTSASVCNTTCKATNCSLATPAPSPTPQPTPTPPPTTALCQLIKMFDENWNALTLNELATFTAGRKVRFTVAGNTNSGTIDRARFTINGTQRSEVTGKRPNTQEFFDEFTIPAGTTTFTVSAQLHHSILGWF